MLITGTVEIPPLPEITISPEAITLVEGQSASFLATLNQPIGHDVRISVGYANPTFSEEVEVRDVIIRARRRQNAVEQHVIAILDEELEDNFVGTLNLTAINDVTKEAIEFSGGRSEVQVGRIGQLRYNNGVLSGDLNGDAQPDFEIRLTGAPQLLKADIKL